MKKKFGIIGIALVLVLTLGASTALAASRWQATMEGNGTIQGEGTLLASSYDVEETDIGWNFKVKADDSTVVSGNLNIVEKLNGGPPRHFKLSGAEVDMVYLNVSTDELRVEGTNGDGQRVAAHFRGVGNTPYPKTVWYWVKDARGNFITNCGDRLPLVGDDFTIDSSP